MILKFVSVGHWRRVIAVLRGGGAFTSQPVAKSLQSERWRHHL